MESVERSVLAQNLGSSTDTKPVTNAIIESIPVSSATN